MKEEITKMLEDLKSIDISARMINDELGFSNGLLGKAANGQSDLSDEKLFRFQEYYKEKFDIGLQVEKDMVIDSGGKLKEVVSKDAKEKVSDVMDRINKRFGTGTIMTFGDKPNTKYKVISTGSVGLDMALGIGGLPRGRMVEIFGLESSGKTTIALNVISNAQKEGLRCLLVDAENAFDPEYAHDLGVDIDKLKYCQPSCGEDALEVADGMISEKEVDVVVIDSVAALVPKAELMGEMGESKMGLHARLMSQACRKMVGSVAKNEVLLIFINQIRNKIGVMMGNPEVVTGGMALQFYASVRMKVSRSVNKDNMITNGDENIGNETTVKVIKNKCAPPFRSAVFDIIYGRGIDRIGDIFNCGVSMGVISKIGNTYKYKEEKLGVGVGASKEFLCGNIGLADLIETELKTKTK